MILRIFILVWLIGLLGHQAVAQTGRMPAATTKTSDDAKQPYQLFTSGRQITVKCSGGIKQLMVWTASGHRVVEQKEIDKTSYSFKLEVNEKIFFLRLQLNNGKVYTQKFGV